ncbi:hypothetical protein [Nocardiopsis sp. NPDC006938]|uniref:AbiTii domain-containing protein n=1 Tax=Nocardiopsis sp. NPDC006938 TaxID=3364337 RepID=UPI0036C5F1D0
MSVLEQIIQDASTSTVPVSDVLRKMLVVSHRIRSQETLTWVKQELQGYPSNTGARLPPYRGPFVLPVQGIYRGSAGAQERHTLSRRGVPKEYVPAMFEARMNEPIVELEALTTGEGDPGFPWETDLIAHWQGWEDEQRVTTIPFMRLVAAHATLPRSKVTGVIDMIRNSALLFALELQEAHPQAGEEQGPTIHDPQIQQAVTFLITNVHGSHNNVTVGDDNTMSLTVEQGDLESLLKAASALGLDKMARDELTEAVTGDHTVEEKQSRLKRFTGRVQSGAVSLTGNIAANIAAAQILDWGMKFLG